MSQRGEIRFEFSSHQLRMDEIIKSRKTEEEDLRRYKATRWLVSLFGPIGIPDQPCEKEFISCLQNDFILGNLLNKIRPDSYPKIERAPSSSHALQSTSVKYFRNVQIFISVMHDLSIPVPEASVFAKDNLEESSSTKLVDCILALEYYCKGKQHEIIMSIEPEPAPAPAPAPTPTPSPTCLSLSWPAWAFLTWETRFNLARCLLGAASIICSFFANCYYLSVKAAIGQKSKKSPSISEIFGGSALLAAIMCLPAAMYGKHWVIHSYIAKKSSEIRKRWIWGCRAVMLLIMSVTMCASVVVTPTEENGKDWVISASLLLTSAVLCEACLLDDDSWGVIELIICFLLVQIRKTYEFNFIYLLGIAFVCYIEKLLVMLGMNEMKKRVSREKEGELEESKLMMLEQLLSTIRGNLRENHNIDVDTTVPELAAMSKILAEMKEKKTD